MNLILFAAESTEHATESGLPLGLSAKAFIIQLVSFVFVFLLLKRFAFTPISKLLEERRKTIEDGVKLGIQLEKRQTELEESGAKITREARHEADQIVGRANKEARELIRDAEKAAQRKAETIISDAEARIHEETEVAKIKLEKDIVSMVSEATEAIVEEKVDAKKDAEIIAKALKKNKK